MITVAYLEGEIQGSATAAGNTVIIFLMIEVSLF